MVSDGIYAPCVRLRFVCTKLIVSTPVFRRPISSFDKHFNGLNHCQQRPSEKNAVWKISDCLCAPCVRLRFVCTKLIVPTLVFRRPISSFDKHFNGLNHCQQRPSEEECRLKGFRRPLCAMRTITLCLHKANRTYAGFQTAYLIIR